MPEQRSRQTIQSVERAVAVLRSFSEAEPELGVTEIACRLDLHKSTVSRILATLQQEGLASQNPDNGKYRLGLGLISLAGMALGQLDVRGVAQPFLGALVELSRETVDVVVLEGNECVTVDRARSPQPIRYVSWIGRRMSLHCTAAGKVLLAHLPAEERLELLSAPLRGYTEKTIVDNQTLERSLAQIRRQGYAIVHEEFEEGFSGIAAPVSDHTNTVVAAISIAGPTYRIGPGQIEAFAAPLQQTAADVSAAMGHATTV